jgi:hypothetical protein
MGRDNLKKDQQSHFTGRTHGARKQLEYSTIGSPMHHVFYLGRVRHGTKTAPHWSRNRKFDQLIKYYYTGLTVSNYTS